MKRLHAYNSYNWGWLQVRALVNHHQGRKNGEGRQTRCWRGTESSTSGSKGRDRTIGLGLRIQNIKAHLNDTLSPKKPHILILSDNASPYEPVGAIFIQTTTQAIMMQRDNETEQDWIPDLFKTNVRFVELSLASFLAHILV